LPGNLKSKKMMKKQLIDICKSEKYLITGDHIVVSEPYIPYIPENWNGVLVLFEAQNLSGSNKGIEAYRNAVKGDPYNRLGKRDFKKEGIGITPWDEGWMDLPLKACYPKHEIEDYAVGNAVLWSLAKNGKNISPTKELKESSNNIWEQMLKVSLPDKIIAVGSVAQEIISKTEFKDKMIEVYFPYGRYASFVNKHFKYVGELNKYPEKYNSVFDALATLGKSFESPLRGNSKRKICESIPMTISLLLKTKKL
jgi:hypothetical protein